MMYKGQLIRSGESTRQEVLVSIEDDKLVLDTGDAFRIKEIAIDDRTGAHAPFFLYLPNGDQIIITENTHEFEQEIYRKLPLHKRNWLNKFETWKKSLAVSLIVLVLATAFWLTTGSDMAAEWLAEQIPQELEYELGHNVIASLSTLGLTLRSPVYQKEKELEKLFNYIASNSDVNYATLHITSDLPEDNALAIPGGHIVFTSSMVERYMSAEWDRDAIAGVVGHELGHVKYRHTLKILIKSAMISAIFTLLTGDVSVTSIAMAQQILVLSYQREQEEEADAYAIELLIKSGMDPEPFLELMEDLGKRYKTDDVPEFFKTHPHMKERVEKMRVLIKKLRKKLKNSEKKGSQ